MTDFPTDSILVLVEVSPGGAVLPSAAGLLGAAAGIGSPVALVVTAPGAGSAAAASAGELGASRVLVVERADAATSLTGPLVDSLVGAAALVSPQAVVISHSVQGRDVAARFSARSGSMLAVDAVALSRDEEGPVSHHSVYGGSYLVDSAASSGAMVVTVRQGAIEARAAAAQPTIETLEVPAGDTREVEVVGFEEAVAASSRPDLRGAKT
ncbi:MAG: electron transfer flavoprotein subunit alpha/FixB family protein, partial [Rhodoglobus sp.]